MNDVLTFDSFDDYCAMESVNASLLKDLRKSPLNAFGVEVVKESAALEFGRMYHTFNLEPQLFQNFYYPYDDSERPVPESNFNKKENKEWRIEKMKEAQGKQLITRPEVLQLAEMRKMIRDHAAPAIQLIEASEKEASLYTTLEIDGDLLPVKCRFDVINVERGAILDLKTTTNATPDGFNKEAGKFAYHVQTAFYLRLAEKVFGRPFKFFVLAQEKNAPYNVLLREVSASMRQKGDYELDKLLPAAAHIIKTGEVKSYDIFTADPLGIVPLDIPQYYVLDHDFNFKDRKIA